MKPLYIIILLLLFYSLVACSGTNGTTDTSNIYNKFENLTKEPAAEISHEGSWTIVSLSENGDRVYWFLAPEVEKVTPAMFKKTVHAGSKNKEETVIVSECEAPKQICDDLMKQFNSFSEKYK
ncbi:MAG: hypothetical protein LJE83_01635 [Gammaproteobacteria bacterium]|nr:hypothetical protein [Gammaproteobacteria bacterium]